MRDLIKRGVVSVGLIAALTVPGVAAMAAAKPGQEATMTQKSPREKLEEAVESLNLTDAQKAKLKPMFAEAKTKLKAIHDDASLSADDKKAKGKEVLADLKKDVSGVLTPEQRVQLKEKMEAAKAKAAM